MGLSEADFLAQLTATFKVEAAEHLQILSGSLVELENGLSSESRKMKLEEIYREAHNLKGAARAVSQSEIESICQSMENIFSELKNNKLELSQPLFDTLYAALDLIKNAVETIDKKKKERDKALLQSMIKRLEGAKEGKVVEAESEEVDTNTTHEDGDEEENASNPEPSVDDKTIRVSSLKLDRLLQQVEEMLAVKIAARQKAQEIQQIVRDVEEFEKQKKRVHLDIRPTVQRDGTTLGDSDHKRLLQHFDDQNTFLINLTSSLKRLCNNTEQEYRLVSNMIDTLLDDTKQVLMQPFSTLLITFPRMVRDIAHSLEKKIHFETSGGDTEVDRRILEELKDPITHIIRNSIDHGIEPESERRASGKHPEGKISIEILQTSGNKVVVTISDDGRGIDVEQVKKSALKQGTATQRQIDEMTEEEALKLIFQSGISTAQIISDLSGRGLGMGIVAEKVEKLGGKVSIETEKGKGTLFRIILPITLATFRGIHTTIGNLEFVIPSHHVLRTLRVEKNELKTIEGKPCLIIDEKPVSFVYLNDALGVERSKSDSRHVHILILKAAETTIAVGVDSILDEQEIFVKNLGPQLAQVRNITAATIMEGGRVVPIIDPFDLVKSVTSNDAFSLSDTTSKPEEQIQTKQKTILIVEDSVTARILLKNILSSAGYQIKTAVDGLEALSILKTEPVDLMLTDVEMPRMNGFDLTRKSREIESLKDLPIVICTSLGSKEDRERGIEAGANAYVKKSSFTQGHLLDIVRQLL